MIDIIGYIGILVVLIAFMMTDMTKLRIINIIACLIYVVYGCLIHSTPTIILNILVILLNLYFLFKNKFGNTK
jgi:hypothetical protein